MHRPLIIKGDATMFKTFVPILLWGPVTKNIIRAGITAVALSLGLAAILAAGPLEDRLVLLTQRAALAAYGRGDYRTAIQLWQPLADQGNADAQSGLGLMYQTGRGVPQNNLIAASWYRKAADQGNPQAQFNLGLMYTSGLGVPKDFAIAASWFRKAADQGSADAQGRLGLWYENGIGVPKDYAIAVSWYRKAADQGLIFAQSELGLMYQSGRGVPQDDEAAVSWYRRAADQGEPLAQSSLGLMYQNGRGMPQDYVAAHMWFSLAIAGGLKGKVITDRELVAAKMTPEQIAEANKRFTEVEERAVWRRVVPKIDGIPIRSGDVPPPPQPR
jgi:uncharacterized protein